MSLETNAFLRVEALKQGLSGKDCCAIAHGADRR
jgi:hypothetical protein